MPHLLRNPVNRCYAGGQQLDGIGVPALASPAIPDAGRFQVCFEEPVFHPKVADVRQAALCIEEYEVQLVLADGLVVPLDDVDSVHCLELVDRVQLSNGIPREFQQTRLTRRVSGLRHAIGSPHLWPEESHTPFSRSTSC